MLKLLLLLPTLALGQARAADTFVVIAPTPTVEESPYQGSDEGCDPRKRIETDEGDEIVTDQICLAWGTMYLYTFNVPSVSGPMLKAALLSHLPYLAHKKACWQITLRPLGADDAKRIGAPYEIIDYKELAASTCVGHGPNNSFKPKPLRGSA